MERRGARRRALLVMVAGAAVASVVAAPAAAAGGRTQILIQDRCDPATFNLDPPAGAGPGVCAPHAGEKITFARLLDSLPDGGDGHWRFSRADTHIGMGDALRVPNVGGEFHTFTEVSRFGAGVVDILNTALSDPNTPAVPVGFPSIFAALGPTGVPPAVSGSVPPLSKGRHMFQCLIHPWMRTVVDVG